MRKIITSEDEAIMLRLNNQNKNSIEISKIVGFCEDSVQDILKKHGVNYAQKKKNFSIKEIRYCKFCEQAFEIFKSKPKKFCSRSCSAIFNNLKFSNKSKEDYLNEIKIKKDRFKKYEGLSISEKISKIAEEKLMQREFKDVPLDSIRKRIIIEQNHKCNKCHLDKWLGQQITLELDHKDGNNKNNKRENLEALCPNCHSLTPTWRGKNRIGIKRDVFKKPEEYIASFLNNDKNIRKALLSLGLAAKGGNYKRMYMFLDLEGIEYVKQSRTNNISKDKSNVAA